MTEPQQPDREAGQTDLHSNVWRLQAIFFEPGACFQEIARRPDWILPLILTLIVGLVSFNLFISAMGWDSIIEQQISQSPQFRDAPPEQRAKFTEQMSGSVLFKTFFIVAPALIVPIILMLAGLFTGILVLTGKEAPFKKVFSVVCHSFYAVGLLSSILLVLVAMLAEDPGSLSLQNPLQTNLGFLADGSSGAAKVFLSSLDLFTFYRIFLLALGLSKVVPKFSLAGGLTVVGGLWVVYLLGATGITYLVAG